MYEYIKGKLIYVNPSYAVIEGHSFAYNIQISLNTYTAIKDQQEVKLFLHHILREDNESMFGFFDEKERILFRHLITVSGVGANTARVILSSNTPNEVYSIIVNKDTRRLKMVKGIGEKTSQRIVLDLADKLLKENFELEKLDKTHNISANEALSALIVLGFPRQAVERALKKIIETNTANLSVEELVKETLKIL